MNFPRIGFSIFAIALLSASQAKAASFNYEFMNVNGAVPGTVKGTITLPDGDGTFPASAVTITSYPASLGLGATPISISNLVKNIFVVSAGDIIDSDFLGEINAKTGLAFFDSVACGGGATFLDKFDAADCGSSGVLDTNSLTLSFSPAAANVPGPLPLLGVAAAFAHSRRLRTRQRAGSLAWA